MYELKFDRAKLRRVFERFGSALARPAAEIVAPPAERWLAVVEREQFASRGRAGASGAWRPLSQSTLRQKSIEGRGFELLVNRGRMRDALTRPGALRRMMLVTDGVVTFRFPHPAQLHQRGTRKMPARKVIDPSPAQVARLGDEVSREEAARMGRLGYTVTRKG